MRAGGAVSLHPACARKKLGPPPLCSARAFDPVLGPRWPTSPPAHLHLTLAHAWRVAGRGCSRWPGHGGAETAFFADAPTLTACSLSLQKHSALHSSYLTELLLDKGYIVHGLKRRASSYNHPRLEHIMDASALGRIGAELFLFLRDRQKKKPGPREHSKHTQPLLRLSPPSTPHTGYPGAERFHLHYGDLIDFGSLCSLLR